MKPILGITMGDPSGNGPEISVKALMKPETYEVCRPLIVGDAKCMEAAIPTVKGAESMKINVIHGVKEAKFEPGIIDYWWKTEHFCNQHLPRTRMAGLHPDKIYKVTELNRIDNQPLDYEGKAFSGAYLMANGLEMPYNHKVDYHKLSDYSSRVLYLEEVK